MAKWLGLWHRHEWGPCVVGTFGYSSVRVKACKECHRIKAGRSGHAMHDSETAERAIRAASGEQVPVFYDRYEALHHRLYGRPHSPGPLTNEVVQPVQPVHLCPDCEKNPVGEADYLCEACRYG
jgi:hypothetical protein